MKTTSRKKSGLYEKVHRRMGCYRCSHACRAFLGDRPCCGNPEVPILGIHGECKSIVILDNTEPIKDYALNRDRW